MYNKIISISIMVFILVACSHNMSFGAISGTVGIPTAVGTCTAAQVEKFEGELIKVEVSYDSGTSWTEVWTGSQTMDIATVDANTKVLDFFAGQGFSLPTGETSATITHFRYTFGQILTVRGYVTYSGYTYRTVSGSDNQPSLSDGGTAEDCIVYNDAYTQYQITQSELNITVTQGQPVTLKATFNLTNALGLITTGQAAPNNYLIVPGAVVPQLEQVL